VGMLSWKGLWISREARVAGIIVVLSVVGMVALRHHQPTLGAILLLAALAVVAAFWSFVVRPDRSPRESLLMLPLAGSILQDIRVSPLDQLFSRHTIGLRQLRYGLEAVRSDQRVLSVVVHLASVETGLATAHEVHRLLRAIAAAGKRVIAVMTGDSPSL